MEREIAMDKSSNEETRTLKSLDWINIDINNVPENYYCTRYFLETRKYFDNSFSWLRWLDQDTLEMISTNFYDIYSREEGADPSKDEDCDFFYLCLSLYFWKHKEMGSFPSGKELEKIILVFGNCVSLVLLERRGTIKLSEEGNGDIFQSDIVYKRVEN